MSAHVRWKVRLSVMGPCPDRKPDPYTGQMPNYSCAVAHWTTVEHDMARDFDTLAEAKEFISKAPSSCGPWAITTDESPPEGMEK